MSLYTQPPDAAAPETIGMRPGDRCGTGVNRTPRLNFRDLATGYHAAGFTRWAYLARPDPVTAAAHRLADTLTPGYFNGAAEMMAQGDMIDIVCHDGSAIVSVRECWGRADLVVVEVMCRTGERG